MYFVRSLAICFCLSTLVAQSVGDQPLKGDPKQGEIKSQTCVACHGVDGNSLVPVWPKIAGQHSQYLVTQLYHFSLGEDSPRYNPQMYPFAMNLTDQDRADLAAYFSSQVTQYSEAENREDLELGRRLYHGGLIEAGIAACSSCHGPSGLGNAPAQFPKLAGQHSQYTQEQLQNYRSKERVHLLMNTIAAKLTDEQIAAVSNYIQGLRPINGE